MMKAEVESAAMARAGSSCAGALWVGCADSAPAEANGSVLCHQSGNEVSSALGSLHKVVTGDSMHY